MKRLNLQIGVTLDQEALSTVVELLTQVIEKGTARQTAAVLKLAEEWAKKVEAPPSPSAEAAIPSPSPPAKEEPSQEKPGLIDTNEVAKLLGVSPRTVWRLKDLGKMPKPVKIGSLVRWPREEIENWIEAGCPASERRGVKRRR